MKRELRVFTLDKIEQRGIGDDASKREFVGHASVFDSLSEELWGFYERVAPTAFDDAIAGKDDVRLLFNHDPNKILARTKSGTLTLSKDDEGLVSAATFPDTSYARDIAESMDRGDVDGMSFGFRTIEDKWEEEEHEVEGVGKVTILVRTLLQVELFDVSIVVYPAYPETDAELNQMPAYRYLGVQPFVPTPPEARTEPAIEEPEAPEQPAAEAAEATTVTGQTVNVTFTANTEELKSQLAEAEEMVTDFAERVGKVLSSKNKEALAQAKDLLDQVLAAADPAEEEDEDEENAVPAAEETAIVVRSKQTDGEIGETRSAPPEDGSELTFTQEELDPHGAVCIDCDREFAAGDEYALREIDEHMFEVVCTDCADVEPEAERESAFDLERRRLRLLERT